MRWCFLFCAVVLHQLGEVQAAADCPTCPKPNARPADAPPRYEWRQDDEEPHWYGLFLAEVQVAAFNARTQRLYIYDARTGKWIESAPAGYRQPEAEGGTVPLTNGVVRGMIKPEGERFSLNGRDVAPAEAKGALGGDVRVPDDAKTPSLTFIGTKDQTAVARRRLETHPMTRPLAQRFLMQEFEASNPMVSKSGFRTDGKPTIYAEMPNGQVLFRLDELPAEADMVRTMVHALQVSEGIRKPDPSYRPGDDPGLVLPLKPQVTAEVSPAPWVLILSHIAAAVGGAGGLVGGGLLLRRMIAGMVSNLAAELASKQPPPASPPATLPANGIAQPAARQ